MGERKCTLIFASNVKHIFGIHKAFKRAGIESKYVHGETPKDERSFIVEEFR
jgi:ATP-dependent helicase IRC3